MRRLTSEQRTLIRTLRSQFLLDRIDYQASERAEAELLRAGRKPGELVPCPECGKEFRPYEGTGNCAEKVYCTKVCANRAWERRRGMGRHKASRLATARPVVCPGCGVSRVVRQKLPEALLAARLCRSCSNRSRSRRAA